MESTGLLSTLVIMLLTLLVLGLVMKRFNQPYFAAYIIAGILLGPQMLSVFTKPDYISAIGELGLLMQMFFTGTHLELQTLAVQIKKPILGVAVQLVFSFLFILLIGSVCGWHLSEMIVFTFIISLSSTAIILDYLEKNRELKTRLGVVTTGILIVQDFLLVPMLLILNFMGNEKLSLGGVIQMIAALCLITFLLRELFLKRKITLPVPPLLEKEHELQIFIGLLVCFGFSWLTQLLGLSAAVGALVAGIFISQTAALHWLDRHLLPFRSFCLSLFFLSIGLQTDLKFLLTHAGLILSVALVIMIVNSLINATVFRLLKESARNSIYAGALLSQIGEFGLVLCMAARNRSLLSAYWTQLTLCTISLTMLISAIWINVIRKFIYRNSVSKNSAVYK